MNFFRNVMKQTAPTQAGMVDHLTKKAPIVERMPMNPTSNGYQHAYVELVDIQGAQLVPLDGELPAMGTSETVRYLDLSAFGGRMAVAEATAKALGGKDVYFANQLPAILRKTGMSLEKSLINNTFKPYAIANGNVSSAGGVTVGKQNSIIAVKWDENETTGRYNPEGFGVGLNFDLEPLNGGTLHDCTINGKVRLGYELRILTNLGVQLSNPAGVAAIVNVDLTEDLNTESGYAAIPTLRQLQDLVLQVEGSPADTFLYCAPGVGNAISFYKYNVQSLAVTDNDLKTVMKFFDEIRIITSYNFSSNAEAIVTL